MKQRKTVVFAESDKFVYARDMDLLKILGFDIVFCRTAEDVLSVFDEQSPGFRKTGMLVLSCLLPPGKVFTATQTNGGARTGFLLYQNLRNRFPELVIYMVVFLNEHRREFAEIQDPKLVISNGFPRRDDLLKCIKERLR